MESCNSLHFLLRRGKSPVGIAKGEETVRGRLLAPHVAERACAGGNGQGVGFDQIFLSRAVPERSKGQYVQLTVRNDDQVGMPEQRLQRSEEGLVELVRFTFRGRLACFDQTAEVADLVSNCLRGDWEVDPPDALAIDHLDERLVLQNIVFEESRVRGQDLPLYLRDAHRIDLDEREIFGM